MTTTSDAHFQLVWSVAYSVDDVSEILDMPVVAVCERAFQLRESGAVLKELARRPGFGNEIPGDNPGRRKDGRRNHKPKLHYCPGLPKFEHHELDDMLERIASPRAIMPSKDEQQRMTDEVYRRARAIREARPTGATAEDRRPRVGINPVGFDEVTGYRHGKGID